MIIGNLSRIAVQKGKNSTFMDYDSIFCNKHIGFNGLITSKSWRHFTLTTKNEFESFSTSNSGSGNENNIYFNLLLNVNVPIEQLFEKRVQIGSSVILELTDYLDAKEISSLVENVTSTNNHDRCCCPILYGRIVQSGRLQVDDTVQILNGTIIE